MTPAMSGPLRSITALIQSDPEAAAEHLSGLSMREQADAFLYAKDRDRLRMIEIVARPRELLEKIPATELWFTIKRLTPRDSIPLIKYSTPEQLQVISDIEWWRKDRLSAPSILEWLEYISACGMDKIVEWFREGDWDQILWFFKTNIVVFKREDKEEDPAQGVDWPREEAPTTHEGVFYFQVLDEKYDELVRYFLEVLVKNDLEMYMQICEACIWEVPLQREEEAFEVRCRRLAEHGFPSFDEAIGVYSPIRKERFNMVKGRTASMAPVATKVSDEFPPQYPLVTLGKRVLLIDRVMAGLESGPQDRFLIEAAQIGNKVLIADGEDIDKENLERALVKVIGYINIGLETVSEGDISKAKALIEGYWLISLFQVGWGEVLRLSRSAQKIFNKGWIKGEERFFHLLEPDQEELLKHLMGKRPAYYVGGGDPLDAVRDFVSGDEVLHAGRGISEIETIGNVVGGCFLGEAGRFFDLVSRPDDIRFTGVIITALINGVISGEWLFRPVKTEHLQRFLDEMDVSGGGSKLDGAIEELKREIFSRERGLTKEEMDAFERFLDTTKARLLDELGGVHKVLEPRFIQSVWIA